MTDAPMNRPASLAGALCPACHKHPVRCRGPCHNCRRSVARGSLRRRCWLRAARPARRLRRCPPTSADDPARTTARGSRGRGVLLAGCLQVNSGTLPDALVYATATACGCNCPIEFVRSPYWPSAAAEYFFRRAHSQAHPVAPCA